MEWSSWSSLCENLIYNEIRQRLCNVPECNLRKLEETRNIQNCDGNGACNSEKNACECNNGFEGDGFSCSDIDECSKDLHNCHLNANCFNKIGSFECICKTGFDGDGVTCHDIDECYTNQHNCHEKAICTNSIGSYTCQCINGFSGDGLTCVDVNECDDLLHGCDVYANCFNSYGSFECNCTTGFDGDGFTCHDIDECYTNQHDCDEKAICTNSIGSYTCQCLDGFTGDGYALNGTGFTGQGCFDKNECEDNSHTCDNNAICDNTNGGYTCHCPSNLVGDGFVCLDPIFQNKSILLISTFDSANVPMVISMDGKIIITN